MANSQRLSTNETKASAEIGQILNQIEQTKRELFSYAVKNHYFDSSEFNTFNKKIEHDLTFTQIFMWALYRKNHMSIYEEKIDPLFNQLRDLKRRMTQLKQYDFPLKEFKKPDLLVELKDKIAPGKNQIDEEKLKQELKLETQKLDHFAKALHIDWKELPNLETPAELEDVVLQFKQTLFGKLDDKADLEASDAGRAYKSTIPLIEACFDAIRKLQLQFNDQPKVFFTQPRKLREVDSKWIIKEDGPWAEAIQEFKRPILSKKRKQKIRSGVKFPLIRWRNPIDQKMLNRATQKIASFLTQLLAEEKNRTGKKTISSDFIERILNSQSTCDDNLDLDRYKLLQLIFTNNYKIFNKALHALIQLKKLSLMLDEKTKKAFFTIKPPQFNNKKIPHKLESMTEWAENWTTRIEKFQNSVKDKERNPNDAAFQLEESKQHEISNIFFEVNDRQTELFITLKNRLQHIRLYLTEENAALTEELKRKKSNLQTSNIFDDNIAKRDKLTLFSKQISILDYVLIDDDNIESLMNLANLIETEWLIPLMLKENLLAHVKACASLQKFYLTLTEYYKLLGSDLIDLPSLGIENIPNKFNEIVAWAEKANPQLEQILAEKKLDIIQKNLNKFTQEFKLSKPLSRSQTYTLQTHEKKQACLVTESTPLLAPLASHKSVVPEEITQPQKKPSPFKGPTTTCSALVFFGTVLLCIPGAQLIGLGMIKIGLVGLFIIGAKKAYQEWKSSKTTMYFDEDNSFFRSSSASSLSDNESSALAKSPFYEQKRPAHQITSVTPTAPSIQSTPTKMKFFDRNPMISQEASRLTYRGRSITVR